MFNGKKIRLGLLACLSALLLLLTNCQTQQLDYVANLDQGVGEQIVVLGDSISSGYGLDPQEAYPALLEAKLGLPVLNQGINGDTTASALARLSEDVLANSPWLVIVGLGGNDFLRKLPKTETEANLREIIVQIQAEKAIVVLLGMNLGLFKDEYKELYRRVAKDTNAYLIPQVLKNVLDNPNHRQRDIIHPNAKGQEILADRITQALKPLIKQAKLPPGLNRSKINS